MKRGYRLNSTAAFSRYAQARQANFMPGGGLLKAGMQRIDDTIGGIGRGLNKRAFNGMEGLAAKGNDGSGLKGAILGQVDDLGNTISNNASRIRKGIGIAGGVGAVGLGGAALANLGQPQQPRMY